MDKKLLSTIAIASMLGGMSGLDTYEDRRVRKPKPKKCRTVEQVKRRKKNRMANKSRALNFKRAR